MTQLNFVLTPAAALVALAPAFAATPIQEEAPAAAEVTRPAEKTREELEAEFAALLTGGVLAGHYTQDDWPADQAPQKDRYTITKAEKTASGEWRISTKIEYGERSFVMPILVGVEWAGDTPVITLTDRKIPMLGTFSARVLFHGTRYAGTWQGPGHGGHMFGDVERAEAEAPASGDGEVAADDGEQLVSAVAPLEDEPGVNWPSYRGPSARGYAEGFPTATSFDAEEGENVLWRSVVPGLAHSSPVVFDDRIYLTSAVRLDGESHLKVGLYGSTAPVEDEGEHAMVVLCYDKESGELLWEREAWAGTPAVKRHPKGSHAASTPATDGEHVLAFFGSEGLYCYDSDGELKWEKDFGVLDSGFFMVQDHQWGFAASPVIADGKVLVQCDIQASEGEPDDEGKATWIYNSFLAALDVETGEELWRTARPDVPTWCTPTVDLEEGRRQVIVNGWKHIGAYDLDSGEERWWMAGGGDIPVPTPIVHHGHVYITNSHGMFQPIWAIDLDAKGELKWESEAVTWHHKRRGNYMQTPLVIGGELYLCSDGGILACYDALTGEEHYRQRLGAGGSGFTPSIVGANDLIYATSEVGEVLVVRAGTQFEQVGSGDLGEECMSTPAISEGVIFWRSRGHLTAVAEG